MSSWNEFKDKWSTDIIGNENLDLNDVMIIVDWFTLHARHLTAKENNEKNSEGDNLVPTGEWTNYGPTQMSMNFETTKWISIIAKLSLVTTAYRDQTTMKQKLHDLINFGKSQPVCGRADQRGYLANEYSPPWYASQFRDLSVILPEHSNLCLLTLWAELV